VPQRPANAPSEKLVLQISAPSTIADLGRESSSPLNIAARSLQTSPEATSNGWLIRTALDLPLTHIPPGQKLEIITLQQKRTSINNQEPIKFSGDESAL
jgi:hypothetical protein